MAQLWWNFYCAKAKQRTNWSNEEDVTSLKDLSWQLICLLFLITHHKILDYLFKNEHEPLVVVQLYLDLAVVLFEKLKQTSLCSTQDIEELMKTDRPDWQSVMQYVSQIYKYFETWAGEQEEPEKPSRKSGGTAALFCQQHYTHPPDRANAATLTLMLLTAPHHRGPLCSWDAQPSWTCCFLSYFLPTAQPGHTHTTPCSFVQV